MSRIKMIIVDDEEMIRQGIFVTGNWEEVGIEVVGLAKNGKEALDLIEMHRPEIVLSDVVMPQMSGLELSKAIAQHYPETKIILISGYEEFDYVKAALEYSAFTYLLKPAKIEVIKEKVLQLKEQIVQAKDRRQLEETMKQKLQESLPLLQEQFMNRMLLSGDSVESVEEGFRFLDIRLEPVNLVMMILRLSQEQHIANARGYDNPYYRLLLAKDACREKLDQSQLNGVVVEDRQEHIVILYNYREEESHQARLRHAIRLADQLREELAKATDALVTIGIGRLQTHAHKLPETYQGCLNALEHSFYLGIDSTIYIGDVESDHTAIPLYPEAIEQEMIKNIRIGNYGRAEEAVHAFFAELQVHKKQRPEQLYDATLYLLSSLSRLVLSNRNDLSVKHLISRALEKNIASLAEMKRFILDTVKEMTDYIHSEKQLHHKSIVENVKEFIVQNCHRDVSLQIVAEAVHISPTYLSWLFKEESGVNFRDYVVQVKMDKSLELLKTTNYTLGQIALAVGYSDGRYFSRVFRKVFGQSPEEFRNEG